MSRTLVCQFLYGEDFRAESCADGVSWGDGIGDIDRLLMCDPQTSGGLLISVPEDVVDGLLADLKGRGVLGTVVGGVTAFAGNAVDVTR